MLGAGQGKGQRTQGAPVAELLLVRPRHGRLDARVVKRRQPPSGPQNDSADIVCEHKIVGLDVAQGVEGNARQVRRREASARA